jgi:LmbE family N-acetylglucosaminyl deacetylase
MTMTTTHQLGHIHRLGTILGLWAHPDDEAYLSAGLMALARQQGQRVVVVTATSGERGTPDPARWPPARLGALRRREMAASLAALGVTEHHWLGLPDGRCDRADPDRVVARLVEFVERAGVDTIVTFGPDGMTGHPDHRAVSAWATAVWQATGRRIRLLFATVTPQFHARWGAINDDLGIWADLDEPPCTEQDDVAVTVQCAPEVLERKLHALRAHASQTSTMIDRLGAATFQQWWATESFVDASLLYAAAPSRGSTGSTRSAESLGVA